MAPVPARERLSVAHKTDRLPAPASRVRRARCCGFRAARGCASAKSCARAPMCGSPANLSLTVSELSANIPPFNPQKLLTDGVATRRATIRRRRNRTPKSPSLPATLRRGGDTRVLSRVKPATLLPVDEVISRVRDIAKRGAGRHRSASADAGNARQHQAQLCCRGDIDPYAGSRRVSCPRTSLCCRRQEDNRQRLERTSGRREEERDRRLDSARSAPPDEIKALIAVLGPPGRDGGLKEGQKLRVLLTPAGLATAAAARRHRRGERDRGGGRAFRRRQIRRGRRAATSHTEVAEADEERPRTTAAACGSTRAFTRPRCATMCRTR